MQRTSATVTNLRNDDYLPHKAGQGRKIKRARVKRERGQVRTELRSIQRGAL